MRFYDDMVKYNKIFVFVFDRFVIFAVLNLT